MFHQYTPAHSFDLSSTTDSEEPLTNRYEEIQVGKKKIFNCLFSDCGKTFKFKSEIKRHVAIHCEARPFVCSYPDCGKTFKRSDALSNHYRIHNRTTHFLCPVPECLSHFTTKSALRYHMLKHNGEQLFECSFPDCDRTFLTYPQLKQHEKSPNCHQVISEEPESPSYLPEKTLDVAEKSIRGFDEFIFGEEDDTAAEYETPGSDKRVRLSNYNFRVEETFNPNPKVLVDEDISEINWDSVYKQKENINTQETGVSSLSLKGLNPENKLEETLMAMVNYAIQENQKLKKQLKVVTDLLHIKEEDEEKRSEPEQTVDVDKFFNSSIDQDENNWLAESYKTLF